MSDKPIDPFDDVICDSSLEYKGENLGYTKSDLTELKALGEDKPDDVSWGDWVGPKDHSHRHDMMIVLAAYGKTNDEIAKTLGMTQGRVSIILGQSDFRKKVRLKQDELFGQDIRKRLETMMNKSLDVLEEVIDNQMEKTNNRMDAAKYILDQGMGKAKQELSVSGSLLADIIHRLDTGVVSQVKNEIEKPVDPMDDFVDSFIDVDFKVGNKDGGKEE